MRIVRRGFNTLELLIVLGIISVLLGALAPAVLRVRTAARQTADL